MSKTIIDIKDVSYEYKSYDGENHKAVDNVSLEVKEGEFLVILGHNGSGKSTLAKTLNGLLIPSEGDVIIQDMNTKSEDDIWDIRQRIGMVFQNPDNQIVATIVEEDVAFGPENQGIASDEIRSLVDRSLEIVEMSEYKKHAPHLLSGGQKQRVAIAGILAMNPDCIVLDEPTSMLDPSGREEVMSTIKKLNEEEGKTIILITHYMDEAVEADRIAVMSSGQIIAQGSPREIFKDVKMIQDIGLDVPQVTELAYELKKEGIDIKKDVLFVEELLEIL